MPLGNPCQIADKPFRSQLEAARAAGKSKSAITYHLNRHGNLDRLGAKPGGPNNSRCKPVRLGAQEWPSQSALDRALGVPAGTVSRWIKAGDLDALTGTVSLPTRPPASICVGCRSWWRQTCCQSRSEAVTSGRHGAPSIGHRRGRAAGISAVDLRGRGGCQC